MKVHHSKKSYAGRWLVKTLEVALVAGLVFVVLGVLSDAFTPVTPQEQTVHTLEYRMMDDNPRTFEVQPPQPQVTTYSAEDYFYMGLAHQQASDYQEAIADYDRAIVENRDIAATWLNRGVAYEQLGDSDSAMLDYYQWMRRDGIESNYAGDLMSGDQEIVEMTPNALHIFTFRAEPGQDLTVAAESVVEGMTDPIILVLDPKGNPVAGDDDILRQSGDLVSMDSLIDGETLTYDGSGCMGNTYTLLVSHAGGGSYGDVQVSLDLD